MAQGDGLTYQWYCKKTGATSFAKSTLSSATKATLSLTLQEKHDSYQYYCKVKDSHGNSVNSNTVKITVGTPLKITTQPVNFTGAAGSTASLKVVAQGDGLTYQWYVKKTGETSFAKSTVSSATKATFTMTLADRHDGYQYYCKVKDSHGNTINSNTVKITVGTALKITTQPSNFTGAVGSTATFKTVAQGDGLTYQWYYKKIGETSFAKSTLASGTKATYTMTIADRHDGWQYYCLVKDSRGNSVKTNTVSITVATPLKITTQPANYTGAAGSTASLKVVAQGDGLTYQWYCKKTGATSFAKSTLSSATKATLSLTLQEKHDGYQYYCKVKDSHGNSVNSNTVKITVAAPLKITSQPVDFSGQAGDTVRLTVKASGSGLTYQWYYKKTGATSFTKSTLAAGTKATYTMTIADRHDGWQYYCLVKDSSGSSVRSNTVTIHVVSQEILFASEVVRLVNIERAAAGLDPLTENAVLDQAATIRSSELITVFSHTRPDDRHWSTVLGEVGFNYQYAGENIARGQLTPEEVVAGWMNSEGHRKNILGENFHQIGVGLSPSTGAYSGYAWVQLFTD